MNTAQPEPAADLRLPREARILRRSDYLRVQQTGRRAHTAHFVLLVLAGAGSRLGVTVGKRIGSAVRRNRIKRVVREVFRRNKALFPAGCDVVFVARPGAEHLDYGAVLAEIAGAQRALDRAAQASRKASPPT
jgi:ribonuclease P protein component